MSEHEDKENHRPHLRRANMCDSMEDEIIAGLTHVGCCEPRGVFFDSFRLCISVFRFFGLRIAKGPHRVNRQRAPWCGTPPASGVIFKPETEMHFFQGGPYWLSYRCDVYITHFRHWYFVPWWSNCAKLFRFGDSQLLYKRPLGSRDKKVGLSTERKRHFVEWKFCAKWWNLVLRDAGIWRVSRSYQNLESLKLFFDSLLHTSWRAPKREISAGSAH